MAQGIISKMLIEKEASFGVRAATPVQRRVELTEDSVTPDYGFKDPETITGNMTKTANIPTRKSVEGSVGIIAGPENGFAQFLYYAAGAVTTKAGYHRRDYRLAVGVEATYSLVHAPITPSSQVVWKKLAASTAWVQLVLTTDYSIVDNTGVITFVVSLQAGDKIMVSYCEVSTGTYSHIIKTGTSLPSFQYWNWKGQIELYEYAGSKINTLGLTVNSEDFLKASVDLMIQSEDLGTVTGHTYPAGLTLSELLPLLFKDARAYVDYTQNVTFESIDVSLENNIDPSFTIRGSDECKALQETIQNVPIKVTLQFDDQTEYNKVANLTKFAFEFRYGETTGEQIGITGNYYGLQFWAPDVRWEKPDLPTGRDRMILSLDGFANYSSAFDMAYQFVVINTETTISA